jgi:hypothetical protein
MFLAQIFTKQENFYRYRYIDSFCGNPVEKASVRTIVGTENVFRIPLCSLVAYVWDAEVCMNRQHSLRVVLY